MNISTLKKVVLFPSFFLIVALVLTIIFFFNSDVSPNTLSFNHPLKMVGQTGKLISGKFTARENYLGIISVRLKKTEKLAGSSIFRIKNVLDPNWYHIATISANQYNTIPFYSFGIPPIDNSKNKTYQFEIQLASKFQSSEGLYLEDKYPTLVSQYQFPKNILLQNKGVLFNFLHKKISYYIYNNNSFIEVFFVYTVPLFIYCLYYFFKFKYKLFSRINNLQDIKKVQFRPFIFFIIFNIFVDIFIIRKYFYITTIILVILWVLGIITYKLKSNYSFSFTFLFFISYPLFLLANMEWVIEKSAIWAYMFLIMGTIHAMLEIRTGESKRLNIFFSKLNSSFSFILCIDSFLVFVLQKIRQFTFSSISNFIKVLVMIIILIVFFFVGYSLYLRVMHYWTRQMENPRVTRVEPTRVYPATKIVIYGDSFGDNSNKKYALMRNGERVRVDYWEDHKIIFTVPLGWKTGYINIWIEKPIEWDGKTIVEKTKPIMIKLLPVLDQFTPNDDAYFEEMKTWRKETREINGYK